ncbi:YajG family lipoprotein [Tistrella sp. BH-R2-4]|uniref:YajG family lipoprotein n=1 Tax=Tistrella arctica TaxID=3133430 RepID=A0ABU9YNA0_9PROT
MKKLVLAVFALLIVSACAFTEDAVTVRYTAPANLAVVPGAEAVSVAVTPVDGRVANRDRVSSKKNGYDMETARIVATNDVVGEVAEAIKAELASLGFTIGDGGVAIVVETQTFYNDFKLGFWSSEAVAEVAFMLTARKPDGTLIYSRAYRAVGMNKEIMLMTGEAAEPALDEALRNAVLQVANDTDLQTALMAAR